MLLRAGSQGLVLEYPDMDPVQLEAEREPHRRRRHRLRGRSTWPTLNVALSAHVVDVAVTRPMPIDLTFAEIDAEHHRVINPPNPCRHGSRSHFGSRVHLHPRLAVEGKRRAGRRRVARMPVQSTFCGGLATVVGMAEVLGLVAMGALGITCLAKRQGTAAMRTCTLPASNAAIRSAGGCAFVMK